MGEADPEAVISVLVCIPTVPGRQPYLANCARGYERGTPRLLGGVFPGETLPCRFSDTVEVNLSVVHDASSAGEGWQRCVDQGLDWWPRTTHIHFSNDDVVPAYGWLPPLVEATDSGRVPAVRVEPAGGHVEEQIFQTHPPMPPALFGHAVRHDPAGYFFAGLPEEQPTEDWEPVGHGNLPFCSVEQWHEIGPFPPIHYGSDRWFAERASGAGYDTVARQDSVFFNYNANIGRHRGSWTEVDFMDFDGIFGLPAYLSGALDPGQEHPLRETEEGLRWVRAWRELHENPPENPGDHQVMTEDGRARMLESWIAASGGLKPHPYPDGYLP